MQEKYRKMSLAWVSIGGDENKLQFGFKIIHAR
jgi:hypothetical protein